MKQAYEQILNGMARAFFACAWGDQCEESGNAGIMSGRDIMCIMPEQMDPAALHAARTLAFGMIENHWHTKEVSLDQGLRVLYQYAEQCDPVGSDRMLTPELFGHYCAMQAMGTGVGLESFGEECREFFRVPYIEFGGHSLEKDYF